MNRFTLILVTLLSLSPFTRIFSQITDAISYEDPSLLVKPKPIDKLVYDNWIKENNNKFGEDPRKGPGVPLEVTIVFIVDTLGNVVKPLIQRGIGFGFDTEAHRLIKNNPNKWIPGSINGKPVNTLVYYQVDFSKNNNLIMTENNKEYKEKIKK
jgi:hypothetical protein